MTGSLRDPVQSEGGRAMRKDRKDILIEQHRSVGFVVRSIMPESAIIKVTDVTNVADMVTRKGSATLQSAIGNPGCSMKRIIIMIIIETVYMVNGKGKGHVNVILNGEPVRKMVDTVADIR